MKKIFLATAATLFSLSAQAAVSGSATVVVLKGSAKTQTGKALQEKDVVPAGTTISTSPRSFVKILFGDGSQMNIGPDTTMKIEQTPPGEPGLVNLVGGQIRAKVTKDLLNSGTEAKDKLIVKTKTAAMGIRGTDFNVSFNEKNNSTALVTFEGNVAMAKISPGETPAFALRSDTMKSVGAGQYSGANPQLAQATVPVKISPAQLESMKTNDSFQGSGEKQQKAEAAASPIPPGVDAKLFNSNADKQVQESMEKNVGKQAIDQAAAQDTSTTPKPQAPPEGFFDAKSGTYAPRAGGFIDLNTGLYLPPPPGSSFDPNAGVYTPPKAMGQFDPATGSYVPPKGVDLDPVKGFVAEAVPVGNASAATTGAAPPPGVPNAPLPGTPGAANSNAPKTGSAPPPAVAALVAALNFSIQPSNAGKEISFDKTFSPTANGAFVPPPPPPPPPARTDLPPPPKGPTDDPYCPTCQQQNIVTIPNSTTVQFQITVN